MDLKLTTQCLIRMKTAYSSFKRSQRERRSPRDGRASDNCNHSHFYYCSAIPFDSVNSKAPFFMLQCCYTPSMQIVIEELNECRIEQKNQVEVENKNITKSVTQNMIAHMRCMQCGHITHLYPCVQQLLVDTKATHIEIYVDNRFEKKFFNKQLQVMTIIG